MDIAEPCDTCSRGIAKFICFDDVRRCQSCITKYVNEQGWNELTLRPRPVKKKKRKGNAADQDTLF